MKTLLFAVVSVMLVISARARLGETPEQIQVRYGKPDGPQYPLETNSYTLGYTHAGYDIVVVFWNGKSAKEQIESKSGFSPEAAKTLFKNISGKESFQMDAHGDDMTYKADGVNGHLMIRAESSFLFVATDDYLIHDHQMDEAEKKRKEEEEKKKLESF